MDQQFYAKGKLLLSSEFLILHGAKALALPLKLGQSLKLIRKKELGLLNWKAMYKDKTWFECSISLEDFKVLNTDSIDKSENLIHMFKNLDQIHPGFIEKLYTSDVITQLEFDPEYGFGSSSTLTSLLAQWAGADPMQLHFTISRGSGYDVACANAESAILYEIINDMPVTQAVDFQPVFSDKLWFVYLGQKQRSSESVAAFLENYQPRQEDIDLYSKLSCELLRASSVEEFGEIIIRHEKRLSEILKIPVIKESHFPDLDGYAKSLGAWGGDFALLLTEWDKEKLSSYLSSKGFHTFFAYNDLVD